MTPHLVPLLYKYESPRLIKHVPLRRRPERALAAPLLAAAALLRRLPRGVDPALEVADDGLANLRAEVFGGLAPVFMCVGVSG